MMYQTKCLIKSFSLLYEINSDKIQSMALYDTSGKLIAAEPVASEKENAHVKQQDWFSNATDEIENIHFPHPTYRIYLPTELLNITGWYPKPFRRY